MAELILKNLIKTPEPRWFDFDAREGQGVVFRNPKEDHKGDPDLRLKLKYTTPRDYRELIASATERKAAKASGVKALHIAKERVRRLVCAEYLLDWRLNGAAAFALGLQVDFDKIKATDAIRFTADNLEAMIRLSNLPGVIDLVMQTNGYWFGRPDEEDDDDETGEAGRPRRRWRTPWETPDLVRVGVRANHLP